MKSSTFQYEWLLEGVKSALQQCNSTRAALIALEHPEPELHLQNPARGAKGPFKHQIPFLHPNPFKIIEQNFVPGQRQKYSLPARIASSIAIKINRNKTGKYTRRVSWHHCVDTVLSIWGVFVKITHVKSTDVISILFSLQTLHEGTSCTERLVWGLSLLYFVFVSAAAASFSENQVHWWFQVKFCTKTKFPAWAKEMPFQLGCPSSASIPFFFFIIFWGVQAQEDILVQHTLKNFRSWFSLFLQERGKPVMTTSYSMLFL